MSEIQKRSVVIEGKKYNFEIRDKKLFFVTESIATSANVHDPVNIELPPFFVVTSKKGELLFILKCNKNEKFEILTAQSLYDEKKIQWFEPLADNYRELLYTNLTDNAKLSYKVFTWDDIYQFSSIKRFLISYRKEASGDWKYVSEGADRYLLVLINDTPYWSDAIGQIPYAIAAYRDMKSIQMVVKKGRSFAEGMIITGVFNSSPDLSNEYDNYFILRGALFASKKYTYHNKMVDIGYDLRQMPVPVESITDYDPNNLGKEITNDEKTNYL